MKSHNLLSRLLVLLPLCILLGFSVSAISQDQALNISEELGKGTYLQRIEKGRQDRIQMMISVIKSQETTSDQKEEAIASLGVLRAKEAVPLLIENITFSSREFIKDLPSLDQLYPSVSALINIAGRSTSDALLDRLEEPASEIQTRLLMHVLSQIETEQFARLKIAQRRDKLSDSKKKKKLTQLLNSLSVDR